MEKEANSLIKYGYHVEILAWDRNDKYKISESVIELEDGNAKIYRFGIPATYGGGMKKNFRPLLYFQYCIYNWLLKNIHRFDIIHACDFDTAFTAQMLAKKYKKKFVYDIFDYYVHSFKVPKLIKNFIEFLDHRVINNSDATLICSEKRKEQIAGSNPKRLIVIHNTPKCIIDKKVKLNLNKSKIKIVYVGILADGRFVREIADFVKRNSEYEFHIGGFGQLEEHFKLLSEDYENIYYYGKLRYDETLTLENSCDIITAIYNPEVPNHYYAAPNKFYEALMLGKPLIMAKNTGMDDIVVVNDIGEVIEYNIQSFEKGIANLVRKSNEWVNIGNRMNELYDREYSWSEMENRLISIYDEI
nr:glycosyltransferase family 4 protein [Paenibacillus camelliae]